MPTNTLDSTLDAISSITQKYYVKKLVDEINTSNAALMFMKKNGSMDTIDGGVDIRVPVRYSRFSARGWYAGTEALDVSYNDKKFNLIFPWAQYNVSITISGLDKLKNAGAAKILDHVKTETEAAKEDILDAFGTGIYSAGTDAKSIGGARTWLSTTATYGGVSQTTNSWLQAKINSTSTALSLALMQARWEACKEAPDQPNLITTTETLFNSFWSLLQPQQRFTDSETAKAGFANLMFNGAPVLEDSYCTASHMVFWNLKHVKLYSHSDRNFPGTFIPFQEPVNQDASVAHIYWAGQMICEQPRKPGAFTALTS
jgi:hypothetical protein